MNVTQETIEQKIAEYWKAANNYGQLAAANHGAAEALEGILTLMTSPLPENVIPFPSKDTEEDDG